MTSVLWDYQLKWKKYDKLCVMVTKNTRCWENMINLCVIVTKYTRCWENMINKKDVKLLFNGHSSEKPRSLPFLRFVFVHAFEDVSSGWIWRQTGDRRTNTWTAWLLHEESEKNQHTLFSYDQIWLKTNFVHSFLSTRQNRSAEKRPPVYIQWSPFGVPFSIFIGGLWTITACQSRTLILIPERYLDMNIEMRLLWERLATFWTRQILADDRVSRRM